VPTPSSCGISAVLPYASRSARPSPRADALAIGHPRAGGISRDQTRLGGVRWSALLLCAADLGRGGRRLSRCEGTRRPSCACVFLCVHAFVHVYTLSTHVHTHTAHAPCRPIPLSHPVERCRTKVGWASRDRPGASAVSAQLTVLRGRVDEEHFRAMFGGIFQQETAHLCPYVRTPLPNQPAGTSQMCT